MSGSPHAAHALRLLLAKRAMAPADKAALSTALYCMLRSALPQSIKPDEVFQNARLAMGMLLLRGEIDPPSQGRTRCGRSFISFLIRSVCRNWSHRETDPDH